MFKDFSQFNLKLSQVIRDRSVMDKLEAFDKIRGLITHAREQIAIYTKSYNSLSQGIINEGVYTDITPAAQSEAIYSPVQYAKASMLRELDRAEERLSSLPVRVDVPFEAVIGDSDVNKMHAPSLVETVSYDADRIYMKVRFAGTHMTDTPDNYLYLTFSSWNGSPVSKFRFDSYPAFIGYFKSDDDVVSIRVYAVIGRFKTNFGEQRDEVWNPDQTLMFYIQGSYPNAVNPDKYIMLNTFNLTVPADYYEIGGTWRSIDSRDVSSKIGLHAHGQDLPFASSPGGSRGGGAFHIPKSVSATSSITSSLGVTMLRDAFNEL